MVNTLAIVALSCKCNPEAFNSGDGDVDHTPTVQLRLS